VGFAGGGGGEDGGDGFEGGEGLLGGGAMGAAGAEGVGEVGDADAAAVTRRMSVGDFLEVGVALAAELDGAVEAVGVGHDDGAFGAVDDDVRERGDGVGPGGNQGGGWAGLELEDG